MAIEESKHLYFMFIDHLMSLLFQAHEEKIKKEESRKLNQVLQPETYIKR